MTQTDPAPQDTTLEQLIAVALTPAYDNPSDEVHGVNGRAPVDRDPFVGELVRAIQERMEPADYDFTQAQFPARVRVHPDNRRTEHPIVTVRKLLRDTIDSLSYVDDSTDAAAMASLTLDELRSIQGLLDQVSTEASAPAPTPEPAHVFPTEAIISRAAGDAAAEMYPYQAETPANAWFNNNMTGLRSAFRGGADFALEAARTPMEALDEEPQVPEPEPLAEDGAVPASLPGLPPIGSQIPVEVLLQLGNSAMQLTVLEDTLTITGHAPSSHPDAAGDVIFEDAALPELLERAAEHLRSLPLDPSTPAAASVEDSP